MTNDLEHLYEKKEAICAVSGKVSGRLRYIRDDLEPLIDKGVPIKHLTRILSELGITNRENSVRRFIRNEYPDTYAKYYANAKTVIGSSAPSAGNGEVKSRPAEDDSSTRKTGQKSEGESQNTAPSSLLSELTQSMRRGQSGNSHSDIDD